MAAEGIRFTDAHSSSTICSPSRYSLFSGQQIYRSTVEYSSRSPVQS
jgi:arylsulfatase A-like enzyme